MSDSRRKKVALLSITNVGMGIIHILTVPFLVRYMSVVDYGIYGQGLLLTTSVANLFYLGLSSVIYVFYSKRDQTGSQVFKTSFLTSVASGITASIVLFFLSDLGAVYFDNEHLSYLLKIYCACLIFDVPFTVIYATLINYGLIKQAALSTFIPALLRITLLFIGIHVFNSLEVIFMLLLGLSALKFLFAWLLLPKDVYKPATFSPELAKNMLKTGIPYAISGLFSYLFITADEIMVSLMTSVKNYAYYHAGAIQIPFVASIYASIAMVLLPELSTLFTRQELNKIIELKRIAIQNTAAIVYPGVIFILLFSTPIVTSYLSSKYALSVPIFFVYNLLILLKINEYNDILLISEKTRLISMIMLTTLTMNVLLNYLFIPVFGIVGAAIATVLASVVQIFWLIILSVRTLNCKFTEYFDIRRLLSIGLISLLTPACLYFTLPTTTNLFFLFLLGCICLAVSYFLLIKLRLLDYELLRPILMKVPVFGRVLDKYIGVTVKPEAL